VPDSDRNRRAHARVALSVSVDFETDHNFYTGVAGDISEGGIFIATHVPPPTGTEVVLHLTLPGGEAPVVVEGAVRWIRTLKASCEGSPPGCGIAWRELSDDVAAQIAHFVGTRETILFEE
jgi:uncharacterized protein (TIGR02266 family)